MSTKLMFVASWAGLSLPSHLSARCRRNYFEPNPGIDVPLVAGFHRSYPSTKSNRELHHEVAHEMKTKMKTTILMLTLLSLFLASNARAAERLENYTNKTVLAFTPHPHDDTF